MRSTILYTFSLQAVLLLSMLMAHEAFSQVTGLRFNPELGTDGFRLGKVNAITHDKEGFIWLSDQSNRSVVRYDGTHMVRYVSIPGNSNSLGGFYPECLFSDSSGIMWIGFTGQGLDRFDTRRNIFTHYRHDKNDPASLSNDVVSAILVDHLGNIWVGTDGGLDLLDPKTGKFRHFQNRPGDITSLSCNKVRVIYEDKTGEIWVGTGFPFDEVNEGGLNRFDRRSGGFKRYMHDDHDPHSIAHDKVRAIFEDSKGRFWIGSMGSDGLQTLDRKTGVVTHYPYDPKHPERLSRSATNISFDHITFITEDVIGAIWIGTLANGINRYDPGTQRVTHYGRPEDGSGPYKDNTSWCALPMDDGQVWISTQASKLYRVDLFNQVFPHYGVQKTMPYINAICEGDDSTLWLGSGNAGLIRRSQRTGALTFFTHRASIVNSLSSERVISLVKDRKGMLWIGTAKGLDSFDPKTGKFLHHKEPDQEGAPTKVGVVNAIVEDMKSDIWIGTEDQGLFHLDREAGTLNNYRHRTNDTVSLNANYVYGLLFDTPEKLWVALGANSGLELMDLRTGRFKHYLEGLNMVNIWRDRTGELWAGAIEGSFYHYDRAHDLFELTGREKIGVDLTKVWTAVVDKGNRLWLATGMGLYVINAERNRAVVYDKDNGIENSELFNLNASCIGEDGTIYLGDWSGYYAIRPDSVAETRTRPQIQLTDLWVNDRPVFPDQKGPLRVPLFTAKEIRLDFDQSTFSVGFARVDFRNAGTTPLYYSLEGYDANWHVAASDNIVHYFRLPPGTYRFRVRSTESRSGEWMERSIGVTIRPPWWRSWWAYLAYAIAFMSLSVVVYRYQKNRLIRAEREKARARELAQAKEVEKAYHELRSTQAQLIQSEKMASLGELTAGIAHEIQNPLNFVNNFSDLNTEMIAELKEEVVKGNTGDLGKILDDIEANELKINHHGKRAEAIVKGMLQHSRSGRGSKEPTDLNAMCAEYLRLAYHGLRAKDETFQAEHVTDLDQHVGKVDLVPQDIGRVLLNLSSNAFYAANERARISGPGYKPKVTIATRRVGEEVEVSVTDNGNGIPENILGKIFQPFFTTKPTGQGTGLGLSLAYDIVKAHGGDLKVESTEGVGSTFFFRLPGRS